MSPENVYIHIVNDKGSPLGELEGTLDAESDFAENDSARMVVDLLMMLKQHCVRIELYVHAYPDSEFDEQKIRSKVNTIRKSRFVELLEGLTAREKEVVLLLLRGLSTKEIAEKMFISLNTAKTHKKNIFMKTGVNKASELNKLCKPY